MKCWYSDHCETPAEFRIYSKPDSQEINSAEDLVLALVSFGQTYLCAPHMRRYLKEKHEGDAVLYIDKVR